MFQQTIEWNGWLHIIQTNTCQNWRENNICFTSHLVQGFNMKLCCKVVYLWNIRIWILYCMISLKIIVGPSAYQVKLEFSHLDIQKTLHRNKNELVWQTLETLQTNNLSNVHTTIFNFCIQAAHNLNYVYFNGQNKTKFDKQEAIWSQYIPVSGLIQARVIDLPHIQQSQTQVQLHLYSTNVKKINKYDVICIVQTHFDNNKQIPLFNRTGIPCLRRKGSISWVNSRGPSFSSTYRIRNN